MKYMFALVALAIATPAWAELLFFGEQRTMSVASHRFEGDRVIVSLRGGGEMSARHMSLLEDGIDTRAQLASAEHPRASL